MAPRISYANLPFGPNSTRLLDQSFADCAALSTIPCSCTGTNLLILNPTASTFPFNLTSYDSFYGFYTFAASSASTSNVTANVNGLGALNVYLSDGITQAGNGAITAGGFYALVYSGALNNNTGGFYLVSTGASTSSFSFVGDVTASGTSPLTTTISPNAVTYDKFQQASVGNVLLANPEASAADYQETTVGPTLTFSGTSLQTAALTGDVTTAANSFATTLSNSAITLAKFADIAANTVLGNNTIAAAAPLALSRAQFTAMVDVFTSLLSGAVPASAGGTSNYLRADGLWSVPAASGMVLLNTLIVPNTGIDSLIDATSFTTDFVNYQIEFENVIPTVASQLRIQVSIDNGASYQDANYVSVAGPFGGSAIANQGSGAGFANAIYCCTTTVAANASYGLSGSCKIYDPLATSHRKRFVGLTGFSSVSATPSNDLFSNFTGYFEGTAGAGTSGNQPISALKFQFGSLLGPAVDVSGHTFASGKIRIYGVNSPSG